MCFEAIPDHMVSLSMQCLPPFQRIRISYVLFHRLGRVNEVKTNIAMASGLTYSFEAGEDRSVKIKGSIGVLFKIPN